MHPQFGLANVWSEGDLVTRGVFLLLGGMSLASWGVIGFESHSLGNVIPWLRYGGMLLVK